MHVFINRAIFHYFFLISPLNTCQSTGYISQQIDLGWGDFDFGCSTLCPILLGLMRERQDEWNKIKDSK